MLTVDKIRNTNKYRVVLSSQVDTVNPEVLYAFYDFHAIPANRHGDRKYLTKVATDYMLNELLPIFGRENYIVSVGYWEGAQNANSVILLVDRDMANYLVQNANELLGQDAILAFSPDCSVEVFRKPEDYCTKVGDEWLRFEFDAEVLETAATITESITLSEATITVPEDYTVEDLIDIAYNVAPNIYHRKNWANLDTTKDEFTQQAAVYIWDKYNEGYFDGDSADIIPGKVIGMINGWFVRNMHSAAVAKSKATTSLNRPLDGSSEDSLDAVDVLQDLDTKAPDQQDVETTDILTGEVIVEALLDTLSVIPYKTRTHTYIAKNIPILKKRNVQLSERVIGELLFKGYNVKQIIKLFTDKPVDTAYYSHDTKASYIAHKVTDVLKKIKHIVDEELSPEETEAVSDYLATV